MQYESAVSTFFSDSTVVLSTTVIVVVTASAFSTHSAFLFLITS